MREHPQEISIQTHPKSKSNSQEVKMRTKDVRGEKTKERQVVSSGAAKCRARV